MTKFDKYWQVFYIYNVYRILLIAILAVFHLLLIGWEIHPVLFSSHYEYSYFLFAYFVCSFIFLVNCRKPRYKLKYLARMSFCFDLVFLNMFILFAGGITEGAGIFINIALAAFSLLQPGIWAVFFAALASCLLLVQSAYQFLLSGDNTFYYTGIHGVGLFATAITALMFAKWLNESNRRALISGQEVKLFQKLNEQIILRLNSGIVYLDKNNRIQVINEAAKHFFDKATIRAGEPLATLSHSLSDLLINWQCDGLPADVERKHMLDEQTILVHFIPNLSDEQSTSLLILEDMSRMVQHAQHLKLASLGRFTASIAHELRNPLGAISHAIQLLEDSATICDKDIRLIEIIHSNCERMNNLIKNVLQLSRREKSKPQSLAVAPFLTHFIDDFLQPKSNVQIDLKLSQSDFTVFFDRSQLHQLLVILCENSISYGQNEQGQVNVVLSCLKEGDANPYLLIQDDGVGIAPEIIDEIFEPFYTTSRSGVGLGLFIAKELCEANQATLSIIKNKHGACFKLLFNQIDELSL